MTTYVSQKFGLGAGQAGLDFVDVDVDGDTPAYVEPRAIRTQPGDWGDSCIGLLQSFFSALLHAIRTEDSDEIRMLITQTSEPNETHLGVSQGPAQGRGLGDGQKAEQVVDALTTSSAVKSGLLTDLEETALLVPTLGRDTISDITTNIIRGPLIHYTQQQCLLHNIPLEQQASGAIWSSTKSMWEFGMVELPRAGNDKLILVPKSIVRINPMIDAGKYYRGYLRPFFEEHELRKSASSLVETLKDGRRRVKLGELDKLIGTSKPAIAQNTETHPEALAAYKESVTYATHPAPTEHEFNETRGTSTAVNYRELLDEIKAVNPGRAGANAFHTAVANLLCALFEGSLGNQKIEHQIHDGRKRIDITMDNLARSGFFKWVADHYMSAVVPIECKNYSSDPDNPAVDQLAGRLSTRRGQLGILVCREINNRPLLHARAKDAAIDNNGYILVIDDNDLEELVTFATKHRTSADSERYSYPSLRLQFDKLIN